MKQNVREEKPGQSYADFTYLFNIVQKADDYRLKKWMKGESNF
jgi:hypothetical protein